jgi:hypothetical protein
MRILEGHERDPVGIARKRGSGGLAFQTKDILPTTSVIQGRMAFGAMAHGRVSGA